MNDRPVSRRQFAAVVFVSLLSPLMRSVPRMCASLSGRAAWLSAVPALAALLILAVLLFFLRRQMGPGEGAAQVFLRFFGPVGGRLALLLYGVWFLFYTGFVLRSGALRLTAAVYQRSSQEPFVLVTLGLCLLIALGTFRAAAGTAVQVRALLLSALLFVALFSFSNLRADNLFPLKKAELPVALPGSVPILTVGGASALFSFLDGFAEPPDRPLSRTASQFALLCAAAALLCLESVGTFGPTLTARLSYPFFTMTRDISLFGLHQRIEAVVIVLWILADLMLGAAFLRCAHEALRAVFSLPAPEAGGLFSLRSGRWLIWLEAFCTYALSRVVYASPQVLQRLSAVTVPLVSDILVFGGFPLLLLVGRLRRRLV